MNIIEERHGRVILLRINRPRSRNALNSSIMNELIEAMMKWDNNPEIGCFLLLGNPDFFAAGADIKEMAGKTYKEMNQDDFFAGWEKLENIRTPKIAAVSGYALGGGCELAMMCDIIYAAENAQFGQPEIKLGVIPGMGGTQRLTRIIGRVKAMELILSGKNLNAHEAEKAGLVAAVYPVRDFENIILNIAIRISNYSKTALMMAKESVHSAVNLPLKEGLLLERRNFHALFNTADQREGMEAFLNKREPKFNKQSI